jgi:hypothetical protein
MYKGSERQEKETMDFSFIKILSGSEIVHIIDRSSRSIITGGNGVFLGQPTRRLLLTLGAFQLQLLQSDGRSGLIGEPFLDIERTNIDIILSPLSRLRRKNSLVNEFERK